MKCLCNSHLSIVRVVVINVVEKLGGNHDAVARQVSPRSALHGAGEPEADYGTYLVIKSRWMFSDVIMKLAFRWMMRSIYINATTKHERLQFAYWKIRSRYLCMVIAGGFNA